MGHTRRLCNELIAWVGEKWDLEAVLHAFLLEFPPWASLLVVRVVSY